VTPLPFLPRRRIGEIPDDAAASTPLRDQPGGGGAAHGAQTGEDMSGGAWGTDVPGSAPAQGSDRGAVDPVSEALAHWRGEIRELAGESTLADIAQLSGALIDLTQAHPSGIAQLYAGRATRLSNLVREPGSLLVARRSARAVLQRAEEMIQRFSAAPIYLVIGVGHWADVVGGMDEGAIRILNAPVMLRPLHLEPLEGPEPDFDLRLEPGIEINTELVTALHRAGADPDLDALAAMSVTEHGFSPRATLARLTELGRLHLSQFAMDERILVGPFVHPGKVLLDDLEAMEPALRSHPIVAALAGDIEAQRSLAAPLAPTNPGDRAPDAERGVGDLAPVQQGVIDHVVAGRSILVDARPGSHAAEPVAAILADAAASGRSVVHVPGTRRAGRAITRALTDAGLGDFLFDLQDPNWRATAAERLRSGLAPWEDHLDDDAVRRTRATLLHVRSRLEGYTEALHRPREPWRTSAYDALQNLADLTTSRSGPRTEVRLGADAVVRLDVETRARAGDSLARLALLGGFSVRHHDTPWFGAHVRSGAEATRALETTQLLSEVTLPEVISDVGRVTRETGLERASSLGAWLEQLEMLQGIRESLDTFTPVIFERSAADMVIATATSQWRHQNGVEMSAATRRRLTRQARDLLRPGRPVADLHEALVKVQQQREVWRRHCPAGGWPRLPQGLGDLQRAALHAKEQVESLTAVLDDDLFGMELEALRDRMLRLGQDPAALRYLPEITVLTEQLRDLGLGDLLDDLRARRVDADAAPAELELAWWASVLESILRSDPALAGYDGATLNSLAERFRDLDRAQIASLPGPVRRAVGRRLARTIAADKAAAQTLWRELSVPHLTNVRSLRARFASLMTAARPVWIVPPMLVGQVLPREASVDLLVIDGAQHLPAAHVVAAIARASQVVLVGDASRPGPGIVDELAGTLPSVLLPTDRARREEHLAAFLAGHGYDGVVDAVPARPTPSTLRLHLVEGYGMPALGALEVEGVDAEVERVVELVRELQDTGEIAVVSLSPVTAERIAAALRADRELAPLLAGARVVVCDLESAADLARDTVILSVGYAKTPHGRVLHRFGAVSSPEGLALMIDALDCVRQNLHIVSCFGPADLDRQRLQHPGARLLADLLDFASDSPAEPGSSKARSQPAEGEPDRLLMDLAERLQARRLVVLPRYGLEGGVRLPLAVGHEDRPGELFVAVLTDDPAYVAEPSLRRRERHWVERLAQHGWVPHMAFATALFMDPVREAAAIEAKVRAAMAEHPAPVATTAVAAGPGGETAPATPVNAASAPPPVEPGRDIRAYSDDELDEVAAWLCADGQLTREDLVEAMRAHLRPAKRGARVDDALEAAARRLLGDSGDTDSGDTGGEAD